MKVIISGASLLLLSVTAWAYEVQGGVVGVSDGDTITVLDVAKTQHKIRLAGIDAPEKKQPYGQRSKENLAGLVFGKQVELRCTKRDRYKREVCTVYQNGRDVNAEQLKSGMAWWYRKYAREQSPKDRADYECEEMKSRLRNVGLWGGINPIAPWEWRHPPYSMNRESHKLKAQCN